MSIPDDHLLVRALHSPFWNGRFATKSAFEKINVSVSSLSILTQPEILAILKHDLEVVAQNPVKIEAIATVSAGQVREACRESAEKVGVAVDILHVPVKDNPPFLDNPAHCEITARTLESNVVRSLTAGMAKNILKACNCTPL